MRIIFILNIKFQKTEILEVYIQISVLSEKVFQALTLSQSQTLPSSFSHPELSSKAGEMREIYYNDRLVHPQQMDATHVPMVQSHSPQLFK